MKINTIVALFLLSFLGSHRMIAQSSFELGGVYLLSLEKLIFKEAPNTFEDKVCHSVGVVGKQNFDFPFFIQEGILLRNVGSQFSVEHTTTEAPEGTGTFYDVAIESQRLEIPLNFGYYLVQTAKLRAGVSLGMSYNYTLSQYQVVDESTLSTLTLGDTPSDILSSYPVSNNGRVEIDTYRDAYFAFNANIDINILLGDRWVLNFVPFWQKEISDKSRLSVQRSMGVQLGTNYRF